MDYAKNETITWEAFLPKIEAMERFFLEIGEFDERVKMIELIGSVAGARRIRLKIVFEKPGHQPCETQWLPLGQFANLTIDHRAWAVEYRAKYLEGGSTGELRQGSGPNGVVAMLRAAVLPDQRESAPTG